MKYKEFVELKTILLQFFKGAMNEFELGGLLTKKFINREISKESFEKLNNWFTNNSIDSNTTNFVNLFRI